MFLFSHHFDQYIIYIYISDDDYRFWIQLDRIKWGRTNNIFWPRSLVFWLSSIEKKKKYNTKWSMIHEKRTIIYVCVCVTVARMCFFILCIENILDMMIERERDWCLFRFSCTFVSPVYNIYTGDYHDYFDHYVACFSLLVFFRVFFLMR